MTGLYDRIGANDNTRLSVHVLTSVMRLWREGEWPDKATAEAYLNDLLTSKGGDPLDQDTVDDIRALIDVIDAQSNAVSKERAINIIEAMNIVLENRGRENGLTETRWRNRLGISIGTGT